MAAMANDDIVDESSSGPFFYTVTAQKPTAVTQLVSGSFTSATSRNVIIGKTSRLEIQLLTEDGLEPMLDVNIYGRISVMKLFRPKMCKKDRLFLITERYNFCVLEYDESTNNIVTCAAGEAKDHVGYPAETGIIGIIEPECRMIVLRIYNGVIKIIPIDPIKGNLQEAFNLRLEEHHILDMEFLHGCATPTIMVLYQDTSETHHVKTYEINLKEKELQQGPWSQSNIEAGSSMLIPIPRPIGGCFIVGEQTITYHNGSQTTSIAMNNTIMKCYCQVDKDGHRYLLGDFLGKLYVLFAKKNKDNEFQLKLGALGETSVPSALTYLDNGCVYVGSSLGDSHLIKINSSMEKKDSNSYISVLGTDINLGPIVDCCVVDYDGLGQSQVITCSGAGNDGSLRVIMNGNGINHLAEMEMEGLKYVFTLKRKTDAMTHDLICLSFLDSSVFISVAEEELEQIQIPGFKSNVATVLCATVRDNMMLQVTNESARFVTSHLVKEWTPVDGCRINFAACNQNQLVVGLAGGILAYLDIETWASTTQTLRNEIACVALMPLKDGEPDDRAQHCAVGLWTDITINVHSVPDLNEISSSILGGETISRSVLFARFDEQIYLLCALRDGTLIHYKFENGTLKDKSRISLGTQQIQLTPFVSHGTPCVFASSDRPTILYCSHEKLLCSTVNIKDVVHMAPLNTEAFPDSLVLISEGKLSISNMDEIQKLHIRTIPLKEIPRRLARMSDQSVFAVLTSIMSAHFDDEIHQIKTFDDQSFDILKNFPLQKNEQGCSIICLRLTNNKQVFVVGTATVIPANGEPTDGRLLLFNEELKLLAWASVSGAVMSMSDMSGKLVCTVNGKVCLYRIECDNENYQFIYEDDDQKHILLLSVKTAGDFILAGDLMQSISLLKVDKISGAIENLAKDPEYKYCTAIAMLDCDNFIAAEYGHNIYTMSCNNGQADNDSLVPTSEFHTGEYINTIEHGSLVMKLNDDNPDAIRSSFIFGTISGAIGVIAVLNRQQYLFLNDLQSRLRDVVHGIGGFSHTEWRKFTTDRRQDYSTNHIDGDLIETALTLPNESLKQVCKGLTMTKTAEDGNFISLDVTPEILIKYVDELTQIH